MTAPAGTPLLRISVPDGSIEILGPSAPPAGVMRGIALDDHGTLRLSSSDGSAVAATYLSASGEPRTWDEGTCAGPLLYEEVSYQLWLDGKEGPPLLQHRDPLFGRDLVLRPERKSASGTFNLHRQIGTLAFAVRFGGTAVSVELDVAPTKIDYATDYQDLLGDVAGTARGLAFAYLRSTHAGATPEKAAARPIEWLTSLRQEIDELRQALGRINANPYRHLLRQVEPTPNYGSTVEAVGVIRVRTPPAP